MPFTWPWKKLLCPFCFEYFHPGDAPSRIISNINLTHDDTVRQFLGLSPSDQVPMHPVHELPTDFTSRFLRKFWYSRLCDQRGVVERKICPNCHMQLPIQMANNCVESNIIAVTGYRVTGKSNFFGVLIDTLGSRYSREVGLNIMMQESFSTQTMDTVFSGALYKERYGQYLKSESPQAVPATRTARQNIDIRIPLIYRLNLTRFTPLQRLLHPFSSYRPIDLVLFDAAGEDMDSPESQALYGRYISRAKGVIALIDPLSYEEIRRDAREDIPPSTYSTCFDTIAVINSCMEHYNRNYRIGRKISTPLAVVLSKFDELRNMEGLSPTAFHDHVHESGYDKDAAEEVSRNIHDFLVRRGLNGLVANVEGNYSNHQYFGMAALGRAPQANQALESIEPINVADPLFWLLYKLGYLQTEQEMKR